MSFIDRLAEQAKTPAQALKDFRRPEPQPAISLEPSSTYVRNSELFTAPVRKTLDDAILSRSTSGVGELVKRLGIVLASDMGACEYNGTVETFSKGTSFGPDYIIDTVDLPSYPLEKLDLEMGLGITSRRNTVIDQVVWHTIDSKDGSPSGSRFFFGVFSYPDGCIGFLGKNLKKVEMVSEGEWIANPNLIEQTLERYFDKDFGRKHAYLRFAEERREKERDDRERYYGVGRYSRNSWSPHGRGPWS